MPSPVHICSQISKIASLIREWIDKEVLILQRVCEFIWKCTQIFIINLPDAKLDFFKDCNSISTEAQAQFQGKGGKGNIYDPTEVVHTIWQKSL